MLYLSNDAYIMLPTNDTPIAGDWDGNGIDGVGVRREGLLYLTNTLSGVGEVYQTAFYGLRGDTKLGAAVRWRGETPAVLLERDSIGDACYRRHDTSVGWFFRLRQASCPTQAAKHRQPLTAPIGAPCGRDRLGRSRKASSSHICLAYAQPLRSGALVTSARPTPRAHALVGVHAS